LAIQQGTKCRVKFPITHVGGNGRPCEKKTAQKDWQSEGIKTGDTPRARRRREQQEQ
jgi:hypothetical protein